MCRYTITAPIELSFYYQPKDVLYVAINTNVNHCFSIDSYDSSTNCCVLIIDDSTNQSTTIGYITKNEFKRIQNAANRIACVIIVVGSRASGKATAYSDWDYIINGLNNRRWKKIKNSMPGAKEDGKPRQIDIVRTPLDINLPFIKFLPVTN